MKKLTGSEIRTMWLKFFSSKGHEIIPSASLVPHDDPTLLWINAGVAPLKKYFDGREKPNNPRLTNAQKSIRTNDIDNVGKTARHHTFFEMLGNFSIGDYFRDEVLPWAAELLFSEEWFGFDKNLIYITYYPKDTETYNLWVSLGIEPSHLIPVVDNFWEIGEGPCGPDTEIFFDRGLKYDPENIGIDLIKNDIENDRFIEIWNIVFSQFNSKPGLPRNEYPELPSKNIDTGCGLERMACVMQEVETNYDSDLFMPLINYLSEYTGRNYHEATYKMPYRVIADHIRSVTFAVADGATLSNEGRGYVLRRILRRAVRFGKKLGINEPFLYKMVDIVVEKFNDFYPYLNDKKEIVKKIIKIEEESFLKTLENGEKKLLDIIENTNNDTISGKDAFLLYDTFGFPIELTEEVCLEKGKNVDINGFKEELAAQKERARNARSDSQSMNNQNEDYLSFTLPVEFVGYNSLTSTSKVIGIFKDGKKVEKASGLVDVVTENTPFYAEMGGQIGDTGNLIIDGQSFEVSVCFRLPNGQNTHVVDMQDVEISVGDEVVLEVSDELRHNICCNHSATHLLNEALRQVLGSHVVQHGSLVTSERLRFDFNHYQNLTIDELLAVENLVNQEINKCHVVNTIETNIEDAKKRGAQAVFGEKYGDVVRLVDMDFSKELCGGTHVKNTSEIKKLAIVSIESKGSGIFRIEAVTGTGLIKGVENAISNLVEDINASNNKIKEVLASANEKNIKLNQESIKEYPLTYSYQDIINQRILADTVKKELRNLEKQLETALRNAGSSDLSSYLDKIQEVNGQSFLITKVSNIEVNVLKDIVDKVADQISSGVVFVADVMGDSKIIFIAKNKGTKFSCGQLVKEAAIVTGGNGGGRPDFAQAGGKDVSKLDEALNKIEGILLK